MNILVPIVNSNYNIRDNQYIISLYEIERKTILQRVFESLSKMENANFIISLSKHDTINFNLDDIVNLLIPDAKIVIAEGDTKGSACSCLLAIDLIDENEPLIITGGDQIINVEFEEVIKYFVQNDYDGGVIIFEDIHPRWSFVKLDKQGLVIEAAEKRPISKNATTGFFYFKTGKLFIEAAQQMIFKGASVNDQYYVSPVFNEMVLAQKRIGTYRIEKNQYFKFSHQSGIEAYEKYLKGNDSYLHR